MYQHLKEVQHVLHGGIMPGTNDNFMWTSVPFYEFYIELSLNFRRKFRTHFGIL